MNIYTQPFSQLLEDIAKALDISEHNYELAKQRYESIGEWLERDGSTVACHKPLLIYPQGSFLLGTVTRPISEKDEYDLDLVSELNLLKNSISQANLKKLIGDEIKIYASAYKMNAPVEEGRRCWTLHYADGVQFHIDILPAIPDAEDFKQFLKSRNTSPLSWSDSAIAITDNTHPNYSQIAFEWPRSNPRGYAEWFRSRMQTRLDAIRKSLLERQVENVPEYKIKTPLQYVIQILKRHRDLWFEVNKLRYDEKAKPISIIITTLAALAYRNEADLQQALWNIVNNMHNHIEPGENGVALIRNPVDPFENFADKWQEHPIRETCFRDWLYQVKNDFEKAFGHNDVQKVSESLKSCIGERTIKKATQETAKSKNVYVSPLTASVTPRKQYAQEIVSDPQTSKMKIPEREIKWLETNLPTLQYDPNFSKVTGELRFCAAHDNDAGKLEIGEHTKTMNRFIRDAFKIEIHLGNLDGNGWPKVYEVGGRHNQIAKKYNVPIIDLHFHPDDDSCCLGIKYGGIRSFRIKEFFLELVIPFFYRLSYTEEFGIENSSKDLWEEYSHGKKGHEEYKIDILNIAKQRPDRNDLCPCGSRKKYKNCHLDEVKSVSRTR